jgi:hypothetical protein
MTPFKAITCDIHKGVIVVRVELASDGGKFVIFWTRTLFGPNRVLGGRKPEPENETQLRLDDQRIARGAIPYIVTWCPKCRGELVVPMDWLLEEAKHSGVARAPIGVLNSAQFESSAQGRRPES